MQAQEPLHFSSCSLSSEKQMAEEVDALKGEDCQAAWGRTWGKRFRLEGFAKNVGSRPAGYSRRVLFAFICFFFFLVAKGILLHSDFHRAQILRRLEMEKKRKKLYLAKQAP